MLHVGRSVAGGFVDQLLGLSNDYLSVLGIARHGLPVVCRKVALQLGMLTASLHAQVGKAANLVLRGGNLRLAAGFSGYVLLNRAAGLIGRGGSVGNGLAGGRVIALVRCRGGWRMVRGGLGPKRIWGAGLPAPPD